LFPVRDEQGSRIEGVVGDGKADGENPVAIVIGDEIGLVFVADDHVQIAVPVEVSQDDRCHPTGVGEEGYAGGSVKGTCGTASQYEHIGLIVVPKHNIGVAISVDVADCQTSGIESICRNGRAGCKRCTTEVGVEQVGLAFVGRQDVQITIQIHVADGHGIGVEINHVQVGGESTCKRRGRTVV